MAYAVLIGSGGLGLERWAVYAGLRRGGYVVQRGPGWDGEGGEGEEEGVEVVGRRGGEGVVAWVWRWLVERKGREPRPVGPLVGLGLYRGYGGLSGGVGARAPMC